MASHLHRFALLPLLVLASPVHAGPGERAALIAAFEQAGVSADDAQSQVERLDAMIDTVVEQYLEERTPGGLAGAMAGAVRALPPPVDARGAFRAAATALTAGLDPQCGYLSPQDANLAIKAEIGGIGAEVTVRDGEPLVVSPLDGTPAAKAGLEAGDRILQANDTPLAGLALEDAVSHLRGTPGSLVRLAIRKPSGQMAEMTLRREIIRIQPVKSRMEGDILYLRVAQFSATSAAAARAELLHRTQGGAGRIRAVVLDLRRTPGGLLDQGVAVADLFLSTGDIAKLEGRRPERQSLHFARPEEFLPGVPMTVLIDRGTAGVAEVVASALRDNGRAVLVGETSSGRGTAQTLFPFGETTLRLTTERYVRPNLQTFEGVGIAPNIRVAGPGLDSGDDRQLRRALEIAVEH
ncbi:MAG: S41 family peptidase [Magnetospirillum sp.]|nr:S41 family peptidase [Magnetospirillum sp.]